MALDQGTDDSVYDFLYVDAKRIAQFLSQFSQYGHLTGLTRTASEGRTGGGGINVGAAKIDKTTQVQEGQSRQFDPQWLNPLTFLDEAARRSMIVRDLERAGVGQIVLFSGKMGVFDLSVFKAIWGAEHLLEKAITGTLGQPDAVVGNRATRRASKSSSDAPNQTDQTRIARALFPNLPHVVQGSIYDENHSSWFILKEDNLTVSPSDLLLRHGVSISGKWSVVGVLDARPESQSELDSANAAIDHLVASSKFGMLSDVIRDLSTPVRTMLGRPDSSFGLTPLLIFREVAI